MDPVRTEHTDDDTATVLVDGEIDYANCDDLAKAIRDAVTDWRPTRLVVDLKDATFIDSTGLGALIEGYRAATESECEFAVVNATPGFRRVLAVTGLNELFGLLPEESQAGRIKAG